MTEYERIKQEISKLQEQLKKIEKNEIKRPYGDLKYFIYTENEDEKEYPNEEKWINKLFKLSSNKTLFVTYYESFNKEKKDFEVFEKTWFSPEEKDKEDLIELYPYKTNKELCLILEKSEGQLRGMKERLGLNTKFNPFSEYEKQLIREFDFGLGLDNACAIRPVRSN
jgi:hypothetical protein